MNFQKSLMMLFLFVALCKSIACAEDNLSENRVLLENMQTIDSNSYEIWEEMTDSYGNIHNSNIILFDASLNAYAIYDLNGEYKNFSGMITTSDMTGSGANMSLAIWADGVQIYGKDGITRQLSGEEFSLDVTGVKELTIRTSNEGEYYRGFTYIVDGSFKLAEEPTNPVEISRLRDVFLIDSSNSGLKEGLFKDSYGNMYDGCYEFSGSDEGEALFNLAGQFASLSGTIVVNSFEDDTEVSMAIYLDDQMAFLQESITAWIEPIQFNLDITDVNVMKFTLVRTKGNGCWNVDIVNDILSSHKHIPGDWNIVKESTCSEEGEKVRICTECGGECDKEILEKLDHQPDGKYVMVKEASCTEKGREAQHCLICGEECEMKDIPSLGHVSEKEWTVLEEATCQNKGLEEKFCSVCGAELGKQEIPQKEHTPGEWIVLEEATCQYEGTEVRYCSVCEEELERQEIPQKEHEPEDEWTVTEEATCHYSGEKVKYCSMCLTVLETEEIPQLEHETGDWIEVQSATCEEAGTSAIYCNLCGDILEAKAIPIKEHQYGPWSVVSGSIWNAPIVKQRVCSVCMNRESKKNYLFVWVKPLVILIIVAVCFIVFRHLFRKRNRL